MNETKRIDEQLESMLRGLPLRRPSEVLDHRVARALCGRSFPWRRLAAAACFGGLCFVMGVFAGQLNRTLHPGPSTVRETVAQPPKQATPTPPTGRRLASGSTRIDQQWPVARSQILYDTYDGPPVRAIIQDTIKRTRWVDPENNLNIELTRPVRQVSFTRDTPY